MPLFDVFFSHFIVRLSTLLAVSFLLLIILVHNFGHFGSYVGSEGNGTTARSGANLSPPG